MRSKTLIIPELKRVLAPPFAWVDRHFLFDGFLERLSQQENLLYFFLVLAADQDGLSFYSYDKICRLLKFYGDEYIQARNGLVKERLIAFDGRQFQVLALPKAPSPAAPQHSSPGQANSDAETIANIFARLQQESALASSALAEPARGGDKRSDQSSR